MSKTKCETKIISMAEIRESLAKEHSESICEYADLFEIFLNGFPGYNSYDNYDALDYYIQRHYPSICIDDEEPTVVLEVWDDGNGKCIAKVIQHQSDIDIEWI